MKLAFLLIGASLATPALTPPALAQDLGPYVNTVLPSGPVIRSNRLTISGNLQDANGNPWVDTVAVVVKGDVTAPGSYRTEVDVAADGVLAAYIYIPEGEMAANYSVSVLAMESLAVHLDEAGPFIDPADGIGAIQDAKATNHPDQTQSVSLPTLVMIPPPLSTLVIFTAPLSHAVDVRARPVLSAVSSPLDEEYRIGTISTGATSFSMYTWSRISAIEFAAHAPNQGPVVCRDLARIGGTALLMPMGVIEAQVTIPNAAAAKIRRLLIVPAALHQPDANLPSGHVVSFDELVDNSHRLRLLDSAVSNTRQLRWNAGSYVAQVWGWESDSLTADPPYLVDWLVLPTQAGSYVLTIE